MGRVDRGTGTGADEYVAHLVSTLDGRRLDGVRVVVDCAHGAASVVGPQALRAAGADVVVIGASPDGLNINDGCGSTHLGPLQEAVVAHGAALGVAYDGDADRCLAVDATGRVVDGDQIMGVLAVSLHEQGRLARSTLVTTVMSNLGLRLAMERAGIGTVQTAVGDRYVLEAMRRDGYNLGGEQSGHVLLTDHATTGDGVLTSLHLLDRMATTGRSLADLAVRRRAAPAGAGQRPRRRQVAGGHRRRARRRRRRRRGAPGPHRTGAAAAVGHRAGGAGDGRGGRAAGGRPGGRRARRGGQGPAGPVRPAPAARPARPR